MMGSYVTIHVTPAELADDLVHDAQTLAELIEAVGSRFGSGRHDTAIKDIASYLNDEEGSSGAAFVRLLAAALDGDGGEA
jgi:hypothetical protein